FRWRRGSLRVRWQQSNGKILVDIAKQQLQPGEEFRMPGSDLSFNFIENGKGGWIGVEFVRRDDAQDSRYKLIFRTQADFPFAGGLQQEFENADQHRRRTTYSSETVQ